MSFCINCGLELKVDMKFCPSCGKQVPINSAPKNNINNKSIQKNEEDLSNSSAELIQELSKDQRLQNKTSTESSSIIKKTNNSFPRMGILYGLTAALLFVVISAFLLLSDIQKESVKCKLNSATSCEELGNYYFEELAEPNNKKAYEYYKKGCALKKGQSCNMIGYFYDNAINVIEDKLQAKKYFAQSCSLETAVGCHNLGVYYSSSEDEPNSNLAIESFGKACDLGRAVSCRKLGTIFYFGSNQTSQSFEKSNIYFSKACNLEDSVACTYWGENLAEGRGIEQDYIKANQLFQSACNNNAYQACTLLGKSYQFGYGVPEDLLSATKNYKKACDNDDHSGCLMVGLLNARRFGDPISAEAFLQKSCKLGSLQACSLLSGYYKFGLFNFEESLEKSFTYGKISCDEFSHPNSCYDTGARFYDGEGVEANREMAVKYLNLACSSDHEKACNKLSEIR